MDIDELERRTHEQIRDIQEEYNRRIAPLIKILSDIRMMRPITITMPQAEYYKSAWGCHVSGSPEYQRAQAELNSTYRGIIDKIPVSKTKGVDL